MNFVSDENWNWQETKGSFKHGGEMAEGTTKPGRLII